MFNYRALGTYLNQICQEPALALLKARTKTKVSKRVLGFPKRKNCKRKTEKNSREWWTRPP